jgi:hypothetical protein
MMTPLDVGATSLEHLTCRVMLTIVVSDDDKCLEPGQLANVNLLGHILLMQGHLHQHVFKTSS